LRIWKLRMSRFHKLMKFKFFDRRDIGDRSLVISYQLSANCSMFAI
jgi:hypothetical protein